MGHQVSRGELAADIVRGEYIAIVAQYSRMCRYAFGRQRNVSGNDHISVTNPFCDPFVSNVWAFRYDYGFDQRMAVRTYPSVRHYIYAQLVTLGDPQSFVLNRASICVDEEAGHGSI